MKSHLVIASKSPWEPPIRREHGLAQLARRHGHPVTFIGRPLDVRSLQGVERRAWLDGFPGRASRERGSGVGLIERSTVLPAHINRVSEMLDGQLLRRILREAVDESPATILATLPWQWQAVSALEQHRRVLDVADDWSALIPGRARRARKLYEQAGEEADEIVVVSERLQDLFPNRRVTVVRNGVDDQLLQAPWSGPPGARVLVYVGTLSERFDAPLTGRLLDRLPGWSLDLYGPCSYARKQDSPDAELEQLLAREDGRARWHGPVPRRAIASVLDSADVLLLPSREGLARGQDSMKVYDCAARGRPIVATLAATEGVTHAPPHMYAARDADDLAMLVSDAVTEPQEWAHQRREWAAGQSRESRWRAWSAALFGKPENGHGLLHSCMRGSRDVPNAATAGAGTSSRAARAGRGRGINRF